MAPVDPDPDRLPNYYAVLNVRYSDTAQLVAQALAGLAAQPGTLEAHKDVIGEAYECLSNPVDRDAYDAFYFHTPCWYSRPLWIAYRNERRRLEESRLRRAREAAEARMEEARKEAEAQAARMEAPPPPAPPPSPKRERRLADSRWADPQTCADGRRGHPADGWQKRPGQVACTGCGSRRGHASHRCGRCDAALCRACYAQFLARRV